MHFRGCLYVLVFGLIVFSSSCARLEKSQAALATEITLEKLPQADSIPSVWGKLISVSSVPNFENWVQLWLQDDEGNIRMVPYSVRDNRLSGQVRLIRRS